jgi:hypothetical protein
MTICCVWQPNTDSPPDPLLDRCSYWLGITPDGKVTYRASYDGQATHFVAVQTASAVQAGEWYRVVAQFRTVVGGLELRLGLGAQGATLSWTTAAYGHSEIFGVGSGTYGRPFHVGGRTSADIWRGRLTHGYYYGEAIADTAIEAIAGILDAPIGYADLLTTQGADTEHLESLWQLDEPSTSYAYDQLGNNNLHWGYWSVGSGPGPSGGFPGIRLVRTLEQGVPVDLQYFTCNSLAAQFSGAEKPMTVLMLVKSVNPNTSNHPDGLIGLGHTTNSIQYTMWHKTQVFSRDYRGDYMDANLYQGQETFAEATSTTGPTITVGANDAAQHVLCCVWGGSPYSVTFLRR